MKSMKKIASLLLALAMIFALATTAFAEDAPTKNDSITVTSTKKGETYALYKLFDLKVNDEINPTAYSYTVNSGWTNFFKAAEGGIPAGAGRQYVTIDNAGYVTAVSDAAALAKAAAEYTSKPNATQSSEATGDTVTFAGLEDGYWLITSTLGTKAMIKTTPDDENVTINDKNPEDTITKEVQEDDGGGWGKSNDAQVGDTVNFKSVITLIPNTRNVSVHDTMDDGLTYTAGTVSIVGLTKDTHYTLTERTDGFDIVFKDDYINDLTTNTELVLTYSAVLNEKAIVIGTATEIDDQVNSIQIKYGDKQSVDATTTTTTYKFSVFKHAKDSTTNLAGAIFKLMKGTEIVKLVKIDDTNYRVANGDEADVTEVESFKTVADGDIVIWGVDADTDYSLEEIEAPEGYNKLTKAVPVTVGADNTTRIDVENNSGTELPSTGGMGTTLFYIVGGVLVAAAVVLLVTKKRMASAN